ncbi:MAG: efflux RND transporter periplasmic adaptor subunit [Vicinamibacterales bacterium]
MTHVRSRPFRLSIALCVSLSVFATACGGTESAAARSDPAEPKPNTVGPIAVSAAEVRGRKVPIAIRANGSFEADEASAVAPQAAGQVVATPVNVGASVRRGDVIVRLQAEDSELRLEEAEAALRRSEAGLRQAEERNALAQANAARYLTLVETGDVSRTVADQARTEAATNAAAVATARAEAEQQRARLALARKAVADVVVRAPFDGFVSERPVAVGEHVTPTTTIATVLKIDPIKLQVRVPGIEAARIKTGLEVVARVDAYPDRRFTGRIIAVNPAIQAASRSFTVEVSVPNAERLLKPGMFATAEIQAGDNEEAAFVPAAAVLSDPNTNSRRLFVIENGTARLRVVQVAEEQQGQVRIVSGVKAGELVATSRLAELFDGAPVDTRQPA